MIASTSWPQRRSRLFSKSGHQRAEDTEIVRQGVSIQFFRRCIVVQRQRHLDDAAEPFREVELYAIDLRRSRDVLRADVARPEPIGVVLGNAETVDLVDPHQRMAGIERLRRSRPPGKAVVAGMSCEIGVSRESQTARLN